MSYKIVLFTDDGGWHSQQLIQAFNARQCNVKTVSLKQCWFDIQEEKKSSLYIPGFENQLPDAAFVRGVPGGTVEEVVLYLDVLHALKELNTLVYNDVRTIERSVDKLMTSFLLHQANIPTPKTWTCSDIHHAYKILREQLQNGRSIVVKPLFGSQGKGLMRIQSLTDLPSLQMYNGVYYLQQFVDTGHERGVDWRIFVIDGEAVAAMRREGESWIANVASGGTCQPAVLDENFTRLAEATVRAVGMYYAGVDILVDRQGKFWVTEVNSVPAWKGLQGVTNVNIAERIVEHFLSLMPSRAANHVAVNT